MCLTNSGVARFIRKRKTLKEVLTTQGRPVAFTTIIEAMRRKYPDLCDDSIGDRQNPKSPYWKHLVASAIQGFKKAGQVKKRDSGWVWMTGETSPEPQPQPEPQPPVDGDMRRQLWDRLLQLDPRQFENVVAKLLKVLGMEEVRVTGRTADGGIDAEGAIPLINIKVAVQAKRYAPHNSVGIDPVQRLIGSVVTGGYERGIFITTSSFTAGARETAEKVGSKIVLIDAEKLVDIMVERGLGIRKVPIIKEELDEGFFSSISALLT